MSRMVLELRPLDSKVFYLTFVRQINLYSRNPQELLQAGFYFLLSVVIFQIAIGANGVTQNVSIGILFASLLFSIMIGMQSFLKDDYNTGVLEQLVLTGVMFESVMIAKCLAFVLLHSVVYIIALPMLSIILEINSEILLNLLAAGVLTIFGATFVVAFCSSVSLESGSKTLFSIISLPLLIPVLIFGTMSVIEPFYMWFSLSFDIIALFVFSIGARYVVESVY